MLLRQEQPRLFCVILSSIFLGVASIGVKLNTQLVLHLAAFLIFGKYFLAWDCQRNYLLIIRNEINEII